MSLLLSDLRYSLRRLVRTPVFSTGALAIMAIAIGANTAVFAVVNKLLFAPLPFAEPDRVVSIYQDSDDGEPSSSSFPAYRDITALEDVFQSVGATTAASATLDVGDGTQTVDIEFTTASFLPTTGLQTTRGRWFDSSMDAVGAGNYAVVNHRTWQTRFGSDPSIVGRTVRLNGQPVTVIGVAPAGLNGIGNFIVTEFWLSISSVAVGGDYRVGNLDRREDHWYDIRGRLAEGVSIPQAQQALNTLALSLASEFPELNEGRDITVFGASDVRIHPEVDGNLVPVAAALMSIVILILVLAATNLGGLLLVRGAARGPEVAVRRALGAEPKRVARLFLGEALLLSVGGGLLGLLLARWLLDLLGAAPLPGPLAGELDLSWDLRVLSFSVALMLATGVFFGLAPALQSLKTDVAGSLREDARSLGGRRRLSLLRNAMVSAQVAVSLILVVGAAVLVRSLTSYQGVSPGVDADRLAFIQTDFDQVGISAEERAPSLSILQERLAALPGVAGVALTSRLPIQGGGTTTTVIEEYEPPSGTGSVELDWALVSPTYFSTVGMRVMRGRAYAPQDRGGDERIVIVNETAASLYWTGENPVGRRIRPQGSPDAWFRVVGVVSDAKVRSVSEPPTPMLFYLMGEAGVNNPYVMVRSTGDPERALAGMRTELAAVHERLPVIRLSTLESHMGAALAAPRLSAGLLSLFSFLALCLASVGVYAIVSFSVSGRRREVGIRVALGAERARVVWMVVREVALTVCFGLAAGAAVVVLISPFVQNLLFGSEILSFGTFGVAALVLGAAVGLASFLPAWRAAKIDPAEALRGS